MKESILLVTDHKNNCVDIWSTGVDISILINKFIESDKFKKINKNIEYWDGGNFEVIELSNGYEIIFSGDNGIEILYVKEYDVWGIDSYNYV